MRKTILQIAILGFFLACLSQWAFGPREDWPFSYFGMYKKRIAPHEIFSFRVLGKTKSGEWEDSFSMGEYNFYAFTDSVEAIVRDRKVTNTNMELQASNVLIENRQTQIALKDLMVSDLEPYWQKHNAQDRYEQIILRVHYWKNFAWEKHSTPDLEKVLIYAYYKDGKWEYSQTP